MPISPLLLMFLTLGIGCTLGMLVRLEDRHQMRFASLPKRGATLAGLLLIGTVIGLWMSRLADANNTQAAVFVGLATGLGVVSGVMFFKPKVST